MSLRRCGAYQRAALRRAGDEQKCTEYAVRLLYWGMIAPEDVRNIDDRGTSPSLCFKCIARQSCTTAKKYTAVQFKPTAIEQTIQCLRGENQVVPLDCIAAMVYQFGVDHLVHFWVRTDCQLLYVSIFHAIREVINGVGIINTSQQFFTCQPLPEFAALIITKTVWNIIRAWMGAGSPGLAYRTWKEGIDDGVPMPILLTLISRVIGGPKTEILPCMLQRYTLMPILFSPWKADLSILLPVLMAFIGTTSKGVVKASCLPVLRQYFPYLIGPVPRTYKDEIEISALSVSEVYQQAANCASRGEADKAWQLLTCWVQVPASPCPEFLLPVNILVSFEKFLSSFGTSAQFPTEVPLCDTVPLFGTTSHSGVPCMGLKFPPILTKKEETCM